MRVEENIPSSQDGTKLELYRESLLSLRDLDLHLLTTEKRGLAYEISFKHGHGYPKFLSRPWFVFAFYGERIKSVQNLYQDANIRVVRGGSGNFYGVILRRDVAPAVISDVDVLNESGDADA